MKVYISVFARPSTQEYFHLDYQCFGFDNNHIWSESIDIFMDMYFWEHIKDYLKPKSLSRVQFILDIQPKKYYCSYYAAYEYDEDYFIDILSVDTAPSLSYLKQWVLDMKEIGEICSK